MHTIRLGHPWQVTTTGSGTRHSRKFGRPRTLDAGEQLWLVCECVPASGEIRVNGNLVGTVDAPGAFAVNITSLLQPRNEVAFALASNLPLGATVLEVRGS